ncbi:MAG: Asp-tRNA(Asn)/Glu-tRNA(Gln) amidotransferase subunit GatA [Pirellulaceae bacterium]|nr:Asp-tRNA(Asn)/Glu-tRNA(Gln) amidotransferase subunit GatA [Pirellulaceae bacterium]
MKLENLSAVALGKKIAAREISCREATAYFLQRSQELDPQVGAYISLLDESAVLAEAQRVDQHLSGKVHNFLAKQSPLTGVPVAIKDVLCLEGWPTTCGSRMLKEYRPPYTATAVDRLQQAGLVVLGKTNMDEFAMGSSTENSALGVTRNPWALDRTPGGSSGGSAAVLAAGMSPLAIGSDTGGSVRQPAAFCGVCGLKPTYGLISRWGLVAYASSLDQVGPMAHHVEDVAALLQIMAGHDPRDSTSLNVALPDYVQQLDQPLDGLRVGIVSEHLHHGSLDSQIVSAVQQACRLLQELGARLVEIHLPHSAHSVAAYYVIAPCEASSNLARYEAAHYGFRAPKNSDHQSVTIRDAAGRQSASNLGSNEPSPLERMMIASRSQGLGDEVKRRILLGTFALSAGYADAYYKQALRVRRLIAQDYQSAFQQVDVLLGPVAPSPAYVLGEKVDDPVQMYLGDLFTVEANLVGLPALSLPAGMSNSGLPLAIQLQAPQLQESRLLATAHQLQRAGLFEPQIAPLG